jgi:hypothetical protein
MRRMGTKRGQMKGVLPWLVHLACRTSTRDFCSALVAIVGPVQNIFYPRRTLFQLVCPHRPASWAGSRSGLPAVLRIRIRDPGSGIRDWGLIDPWIRDPGSRIRNRFIPDPGSRIPDPGSQTHIFEGLVTTFWVKSSIIL